MCCMRWLINNQRALDKRHTSFDTQHTTRHAVIFILNMHAHRQGILKSVLYTYVLQNRPIRPSDKYIPLQSFDIQ